jgi:DNA-binding IclR family transcriptional regulator
MQAPTYAQFRTFAAEQGLSIADVARHTQAPYKTAERILVHLAGTH